MLRNSLDPAPDSRSSGSGLKFLVGSGSGFNCIQVQNTGLAGNVAAERVTAVYLKNLSSWINQIHPIFWLQNKDISQWFRFLHIF